MNITYGDTSLAIRFLEAFLQNEYSNTLRVSGIYDTYTHNNLIDYATLPKVLDSNEMFDVLMGYYDKLGTYDNPLNVFILSRSSNTIIFQSKATSENAEIEIIMELLRVGTPDKLSIFNFVKKYGWSVTTFISKGKSKDLYKIVLTQDARKNLIPTDALSLINLSTENFIFNTTIDGIIKTSHTDCCMIIPCEPDTEYIICHRFDNPNSLDPSKQDPVTLTVATSPVLYPNDGEFCEVSDIETFSLVRGECSTPYKVSDDLRNKSIVISYAYDKQTYNKSLLVIKKSKFYDESTITYIDDGEEVTKNIFIDTEDFINNYWLVNSKYMDYVFGSTINEYSTEEDIYHAQKMFKEICPSYVIRVPGVYTEDFKEWIFRYQALNLKDDVHNPIHYALGYIDVETEARLVRDIDRRFIMG